jgi:hypothetical protein
MMFQNGFVLAIRDSKGNILRESGGQVYLPFHSEYSVFLKNTKTVRAAVKVRIDGMDALGGQEIIVPANGTVDLERFMLDGNLHSGKRFKFVPAGDSAVQDPTSRDNGLVEAVFYEEWPVYQPMPFVAPNPPQQDHWRYFSAPDSGTPTMTNCFFSSSVGAKSMDGAKLSYCADSMSAPMAMAAMPAASAGATVEGSHSGQSFHQVNDFNYNRLVCEVRLALRLVGSQQPVTVKDTKHIHCSFCGKKNAFSANFCQGCGMKIARI